MKTCSRCKRDLPEDEFSFRDSRRTARKNQCKACIRAVSAAHYQAKKDEYYVRNRRVRDAIADLVREYKATHPCADCGKSYPYYVMDFDHLPGFEKRFPMSRASTRSGLKTVHLEMAKCDVVCANCHRVRTHFRSQ